MHHTLSILLVICASIGGIFFACLEIHDLNKVIREDNQKIGIMIEENKQLQDDFDRTSKLLSGLLEKCSVGTSTVDNMGTGTVESP